MDTVVCAPDDVWRDQLKHVEQFPDINNLCDVASCWIYIGILLGAHYILHINRIRVKADWNFFYVGFFNILRYFFKVTINKLHVNICQNLTVNVARNICGT